MRNYIEEATVVDQRVNLIGVVVETSLHKSTKGTDFFCSAKIVDESTSSGMYIHFFAETMENLPHVESVGDILVVSHVVVKSWSSELFATFNKKFSSFALFGGRGPSIVPYQVSLRYNPREQDKKFIFSLRKWSTQHKIIEGFNQSLLFREIMESEQCNLLCKILHISQVKEDEWMLFVWDGTDAPPAPVEAKLEDKMEDALPLQMEPSPLSRDILCTFPTVGTVLRMVVDQGEVKLDINFFKTNRWVKFVNVKCEVRATLWNAVLRPSSKLCYLPEDDESIIGRIRSHDERVSSRWGRMPFTSLPWPSHITETDHPAVPFVTLMDVLTHPKVTYKFKCVVRVIAIFPWRAEDFLSPHGIYRVRLTLEDPTARIHACLYAEDGVKFFENFHSIDMLTKKRNMLLGVANEGGGSMGETVAINPPWIQCCLKSYYINKNDIWGSRNYRIFDTSVVG